MLSNTYRRTQEAKIVFPEDMLDNLIMWDVNFTPDNPLYRLSMSKKDTPSKMVKFFFNLDIDDKGERAILFNLKDGSGRVRRTVQIAPLKEFAKMASYEQRKCICNEIKLQRAFGII